MIFVSHKIPLAMALTQPLFTSIHGLCLSLIKRVNAPFDLLKITQLQIHHVAFRLGAILRPNPPKGSLQLVQLSTIALAQISSRPDRCFFVILRSNHKKGSTGAVKKVPTYDFFNQDRK